MRHLALLLPFFVTCAAAADWQPIASLPELEVFADRATLRRDGDIVQVSEVRDYRSPQSHFTGLMWRSATNQRQYDCNSGKSRLTRVSLHTAPMGAGDPAEWNDAPGAPWLPVEAASPTEAVLKAVCANAAK